MKVQIACVTRGMLHPLVSNMLARNVYELAINGVEVPTPLTYDQMPISHARNTACQDFLESKADYLFFYDSDIVLGSVTISRLLGIAEAHTENPPIKLDNLGLVEIVSGWYKLRKNPKLTSLGFFNIDKVNIKFPPDPTQFPPIRFYETTNVEFERITRNLLKVENVGAGCLLIKRSALLKLEQPWFLFDQEARFGEDAYFSLNALAHKVQIIVDLDQEVGHIHWSKL